MFFAVVFHKNGVASVLLLFGICDPSTVRWFIVSVHVDAVYREAFVVAIFHRPFFKANEVTPFLANRNTPPTVIFVVLVIRVFTATNHATPNTVDFRPRHVVP